MARGLEHGRVMKCPYNNCGLPGLHELKLPPRKWAPGGTTTRYCLVHLIGVLATNPGYQFHVLGRDVASQPESATTRIAPQRATDGTEPVSAPQRREGVSDSESKRFPLVLATSAYEPTDAEWACPACGNSESTFDEHTCRATSAEVSA